MKISNVVKALEKSGLKIEKEIVHKFPDNTCNILWSCISGKYIASFYEQDHDKGNVDSICVERLCDRNDAMTDYFPGTFYHTIKSLINTLTK
jgi:hypothetical protein